jgi:hypothetical protein
MIFLAYILSGLSLLMSVFFLFKPKVTLGFLVWFPLIAGALSPFWAFMGAAGALIGLLYQALWAVPMGIVGALTMIWYVRQNSRDHNGFEKAFGAGWSDQILPQQAKRMVNKRWSLFLKLKASPEPSWERDIPFWSIPDTDRQLLCDIWRPADGSVSGLAFVFLHGSSWAIFDKDFGTRPFFNHLTAQGHTVMDAAYPSHPCSSWFSANAAHAREQGLPCSPGRHRGTLYKTG